MSINPARFGLITNEYRYREVSDAVIASRYLKARELEIDTYFDLPNITALLTSMFAVVGAVRRRFLVVVKGTDHITIDSFAGQIPARLFTAPEFGVTDLPVIIARAQINNSENRTYLELWG